MNADTTTQETTAEQSAESITGGNEQKQDVPENVGNGADSEVIYAANPSAKPTAIKLGITVILGILSIGYLMINPQLLGAIETTQIAVYIVAFLVLLVAVRFLVRMYLLTRYRYVITDTELRWEYSLFYQSRSRELPLEKLRGHQHSQDRIQNVIGVGTLQFLTAVDSQGLGYMAFENVRESEDIQKLVRNQLQSRY